MYWSIETNMPIYLILWLWKLTRCLCVWTHNTEDCMVNICVMTQRRCIHYILLITKEVRETCDFYHLQHIYLQTQIPPAHWNTSFLLFWDEKVHIKTKNNLHLKIKVKLNDFNFYLPNWWTTENCILFFFLFKRKFPFWTVRSCTTS